MIICWGGGISLLVKFFSTDTDLVFSQAINRTIMENGAINEYVNCRFPAYFDGMQIADSEDLMRVCVAPWAKLFRREVFQLHDLRYPEGLHYEDIFLHWTFCVLAPRIYFIPAPTYVYTTNRPDSIMSNTNKKTGNEKAFLKIVRRIFEFHQKNGTFVKINPIAAKLAERYYEDTKKYSDETKYPYYSRVLRRILREFDVDCENCRPLRLIKNRSWFTVYFRRPKDWFLPRDRARKF